MTESELLAFVRAKLPHLQSRAKFLAEAIAQNLPVFTQKRDQIHLILKGEAIALTEWSDLERRRFPVRTKEVQAVLSACRRMGKLLDELRRRFKANPESIVGLVGLTSAVNDVHRTCELIREHYAWEKRFPIGREIGEFAAAPKPIASARLTTLLFNVRLLDEAIASCSLNPLLTAHLAALGGTPKKQGSKRKRRRTSPRAEAPLTNKQVEAMQLVGECKGNFAAAAKAAGKSRQAMKKLYDKGASKVGLAAPKHRTQRLPTDRRGQEMIPSPEDE